MENLSRKIQIWFNIAVVLVLMYLCAGLLVGCGGNSPVGTWRVDRVVVDNVSISARDSDKKGQDATFDNEITLNKDHTGTVSIGETKSVSASWEQEGNTLKLKYADHEYAYILSGAELTRKEDKIKIFYKKI